MSDAAPPPVREGWRPEMPTRLLDAGLSRESMWHGLPEDGSWVTNAEWRSACGFPDVCGPQWGLAASAADVHDQRVFLNQTQYSRRGPS